MFGGSRYGRQRVGADSFPSRRFGPRGHGWCTSIDAVLMCSLRVSALRPGISGRLDITTTYASYQEREVFGSCEERKGTDVRGKRTGAPQRRRKRSKEEE